MNSRILQVCAFLVVLFGFGSVSFAQYVPATMAAQHHGAPPSGPAIVQPTSAQPLAAICAEYNSGGAVTCAYPLNVTSGNEAYVLLLAGGAGTFGTPSCSSGTATIGAFTAIGGGGTVASGAQQWYRATITGSGSCTISETYSVASNVGVFPFEVSNDGGVDTGINPVYHGVTSSFCSSACALGSITPGTTNDLILGVVMVSGGGSTISPLSITPYTLSGNGAGTVSSDIPWITANYTAPSTSTISATFTPTATLGGNVYYDSSLAIK